MASQAKIVPFDAARAESSRSRPSVAAQKRSKKPTRRTSESFKKTSGNKEKLTSRKNVQSSKRNSEPLLQEKPVRSSSQWSKASSRNTQQKNERQTSASRTRRNDTSSLKHTKQRAALSQKESRRNQGSDEEKSSKAAKVSKFSELKKSYTKERAGKKFSQQFGGNESSSASDSNAPRAALYKGEMGKSHKRATKAQANPSSKTRVSSPQGGSKLASISPKKMSALVAVFCLVISLAFVYAPAKQYYVTSKEQAQLQAEYELLQQRNEKLKTEVDTLMTNEGVEDRAREEFGWVKEGENAVNVYGLETVNSETNVHSSIPSGSVSAPETWYSPLLDAVFNVS